MYLFDTDHLAIMQRQSAPAYARLVARMRPYPSWAFYLCIVSFHEQALGANTYVNRARTAVQTIDGYRLFERILMDFSISQVLPFDQPAAATFDSLRSQRVRIGTMDLRIAAIALARDLVVLTRNLVDFCKVPGLKVEDWTV
jgi:tRNA(fMet)-specific endonuclease VapC